MTRWIFAAVAVLALGGSAQTQQAQHQHPQPPQPAADMAAKCKAMMAQHEAMMTEMKAADQKLDGLVAAMNGASGPAKVDATAAAVTEIVAQKTTMHGRMMGVHQGMTGHMMEHMQAGAHGMAMCPMMKMGDRKP